ncbi:MAG TPA: hypothetical protein VN282_21630 [Pyrinomonadaceae bacterium]|nr:hypothetical protein [Pyrinomonadaceae bacterium]
MWKDYVDIFSALLTPTIALITTYIAIQQYRRERAKFRHELYDRRLAVFKAASKYLAIVTSYNTIIDTVQEEINAYNEFVAANMESQFLFDKEDWLYLGNIHMTGTKRSMARLMLRSDDPASVKEYEQSLAEAAETHREQAMRLREVFVKYLDVKKLK